MSNQVPAPATTTGHPPDAEGAMVAAAVGLTAPVGAVQLQAGGATPLPLASNPIKPALPAAIASSEAAGPSHAPVGKRPGDAVLTEEEKCFGGRFALHSQSGQLRTPEGVLLLAMADDRILLSETLCVVRENVEVFCATDADVKAPAPGRKRPVTVGQIGLRCIHCRNATNPGDRVKRAICFPSSLKQIYRTVIDMKLDHFTACRYVPQELKTKLAELKQTNGRSAGATMQYFVGAAKKMGMIDGPDGNGVRCDPSLVMTGPPLPPPALMRKKKIGTDAKQRYDEICTLAEPKKSEATTLPSAEVLPTKPATTTATASIAIEAGEKTLPNGVAAAAAAAPTGPTGIASGRPLSEMPRRKNFRKANNRQCGHCDYCLVDECGTCKACLDMPRFGGAHKKRKKCFSRPNCPNRPAPSPRQRKRKILIPAPPPAAPLPAALPPLPAEAPPMTVRTQPPPDLCGKCQNYMAEHCGLCLLCLTNPRKDNIVLQGVPPDRFNMSEILSFPVVFSYHVPTASRKAPVVPIAQTLAIASEVVEALDKNELVGPPDPSTKANNGDDGAEEDGQALKPPADVIVIDAIMDNKGESTKVDSASSAKESESEGVIVAESSGVTEKAEDSGKRDDVEIEKASSPEQSGAEGKNREEEPTKSDTESVPPRPIITEEDAETSRLEAERQQKQWDRLMKSSIARFERRRAGGKNYSRLPSNTNRSQSEAQPSSDNEHAAEGVRRSGRNRTRSRESLERESDGDDDDEDYSEGEKDSVTQENYASTSSEPAKDLPSGWILEKVTRSCGMRKDRYWYSPILKKKFKSRVDVDRFLAKMEIAKDRLGTAKPRDSPLAKSKTEEKVSAESSEVSEVFELQTEKGVQKEDNNVANDSNSNEDQAKVEELAWKLLLEDRAREKARRRRG